MTAAICTDNSFEVLQTTYPGILTSWVIEPKNHIKVFAAPPPLSHIAWSHSMVFFVSGNTKC